VLRPECSCNPLGMFAHRNGITAPTFTSYGAIGTSAMVYVISGAVVIEIFAVPALYAAWRGR
jgi:hypothetical protein